MGAHLTVYNLFEGSNSSLAVPPPLSSRYAFSLGRS